MTNVHTMEIGDVDTARLVARCRAENTTVHAAILTAACRVRTEERDEDFVRAQPHQHPGPVKQSQTDGEYVTGITTYEGTLRMVTCGYSVPTTFLKGVGDALVAAIERP